jgi:hypothetical protein
MTELWIKTGPGNYQAEFLQHSLRIIRNPDWPQDSRRYQPVVNGHPIDTPKATLRSAQTAACQYVTRSIATAPSGTARPAPDNGGPITDADFAEVDEQPARALPPPAPEPQTVTFVISGTVTTTDHIAAMTEIRAAFDMLRSVADVQCRIVPPDFIDL